GTATGRRQCSALPSLLSLVLVWWYGAVVVWCCGGMVLWWYGAVVLLLLLLPLAMDCLHVTLLISDGAALPIRGLELIEELGFQRKLIERDVSFSIYQQLPIPFAGLTAYLLLLSEPFHSEHKALDRETLTGAVEFNVPAIEIHVSPPDVFITGPLLACLLIVLVIPVKKDNAKCVRCIGVPSESAVKSHSQQSRERCNSGKGQNCLA
ncbi:hypothetical protein GQX74_009457, partial [Glossina fuscipes]